MKAVQQFGECPLLVTWLSESLSGNSACPCFLLGSLAGPCFLQTAGFNSEFSLQLGSSERTLKQSLLFTLEEGGA